jgi:hypothetical protein
MKKRTIITTEKREVWVISEGGGQAILEQTDEEPVYANVSITPAKQNDADVTPEEEPLEGS